MTLITNLYTAPKALRNLNVWSATADKSSNGKYVYTGYNHDWAVLLSGVASGCVVAVDFSTSRRDAFKLENCQTIYSGSTTLASVYESGHCSLYCSDGDGVSATDWGTLRQYGLDWFDGEYAPGVATGVGVAA